MVTPLDILIIIKSTFVMFAINMHAFLTTLYMCFELKISLFCHLVHPQQSLSPMCCAVGPVIWSDALSSIWSTHASGEVGVTQSTTALQTKRIMIRHKRDIWSRTALLRLRSLKYPDAQLWREKCVIHDELGCDGSCVSRLILLYNNGLPGWMLLLQHRCSKWR